MHTLMKVPTQAGTRTNEVILTGTREAVLERCNQLCESEVQTGETTYAIFDENGLVICAA